MPFKAKPLLSLNLKHSTIQNVKYKENSVDALYVSHLKNALPLVHFSSALLSKEPMMFAKSGVTVPGIPRVDHGNQGRKYERFCVLISCTT